VHPWPLSSYFALIASMNDSLFIRSLYSPQQPAENATGSGKLYYKEYNPAESLRPYIHCYWELKTSEPLKETYAYRVVADGCIDMIIDSGSYNGILLAGIADTSFNVPLLGQVSYFGIRFLPAGINHFFRIAANEIQNQMIASDDLLPVYMKEFSSVVYEQANVKDKIKTANSFFLNLLWKQNTALHPGLSRALYHILSTNGEVAIQTKAADWISPRQLRRLFHEHVGCSPKLFARIIRFQQTLRSIQSSNARPSLLSMGYFDQAHFIKEFRTFYGDTPSILKSPIGKF
jgi:hypothetical protein